MKKVDPRDIRLEHYAVTITDIGAVVEQCKENEYSRSELLRKAHECYEKGNIREGRKSERAAILTQHDRRKQALEMTACSFFLAAAVLGIEIHVGTMIMITTVLVSFMYFYRDRKISQKSVLVGENIKIAGVMRRIHSTRLAPEDPAWVMYQELVNVAHQATQCPEEKYWIRTVYSNHLDQLQKEILQRIDKNVSKEAEMLQKHLTNNSAISLAADGSTQEKEHKDT